VVNIPKTEHRIPKAGIFAKKLPLLLVILPLLVVGCTTTRTYVAYDGPCPLRPALEPISEEVQVGTSDAIRGLVDDDVDAAKALTINLIADHERDLQTEFVKLSSDNQLKLKQHIKLLEAVSGCKQR